MRMDVGPVHTARLVRASDPSAGEAPETVKRALRYGAGVRGAQSLVLAAKRRPYHDVRDFAALGLDPAQAEIVAVKSGYLSPDLSALAAANMMALSPGVVDQDIRRLVRRRKTQPTFPFDLDIAWRPEPRVSSRRLA